MSGTSDKQSGSLSRDKLDFLIQRLQQKSRKKSAPEFYPRPRDQAHYPCSHAQQRLWILDRLQPGSPTYNVAGGVSLKGPLQVPALQRSLAEILRRHEILRTTFIAVDGQPRQVIGEAAGVALGNVDLARLTPNEQEEQLRRLASREARRTPLAEAVMALEPPVGLQLRVLMTGGDKLHTVPRPAMPYALVNHYGPTESTVVTTRGLVPAEPSAAMTASAPPIGHPIDNTRVYVLDSYLWPVPVDRQGEIYIGGEGLARGYHNHPGLTAAKFVPDPWCGMPGLRLYRSGGQLEGMSQGIRPSDGVEVLRRVLSRSFREPQMSISTRSVNELLKQLAKMTRDSLADGVELRAKPTSTQGLDLSPEQLFEYQTVAQLAELQGTPEEEAPAAKEADEWSGEEDEEGDFADSGLAADQLEKVLGKLKGV